MTPRASQTHAALAAGLVVVVACLLVAAPGQAQSTAPPAMKVIGGVKQQVSQQPAQKAAPAAAAPAAPEGAPQVVKRRDPFRSLLVSPDQAAGGQPLPPGKRGLVIAQVTVNGVVATPTEMIAVVTMAGRNRSYFLREGDELYNGTVGKISEDGVVFKEKTTDAFGKEYEREVVKQLTSGTGSGTRSGGGARPAARPSSGTPRPGPGA
ncbi:MAG: hypothetical protein A3D93_03950 [Acidobacteria bacterium RIFCSPHIGHO2_12_FULL_67_30]|nr:MAG: hypothetical protein A3B65_07980 [Acidobacteria bacterium RIFCSPHIGHO2_02_FULL_67_57]OFV87471.1 MAG: hypothetical protein A3D93_03950 [Acidobacteria bacterium RIFCSPHIGHO2_12_FULL_67_30]